jgi:hypothetical protein
MRPRHAMKLGCLLFGLAPGLVFGQSPTVHHFAGHAFRLSLPDGYDLGVEKSTEPRVRVFAFATPPRPEGTRSMIAVTLFDLRREDVLLERFTEKARAGLRQLMKTWDGRETDAGLAGVPVKRVEWTGKVDLGRPDLPKVVAARGVAYVGIKDGIGFIVDARDLEPFAVTTVPLCERALATFALEPEAQGSR